MSELGKNVTLWRMNMIVLEFVKKKCIGVHFSWILDLLPTTDMEEQGLRWSLSVAPGQK